MQACTGPLAVLVLGHLHAGLVDQIRSLEMFQSRALDSEIIFSGTSASVPCK